MKYDIKDKIDVEIDMLNMAVGDSLPAGTMDYLMRHHGVGYHIVKSIRNKHGLRCKRGRDSNVRLHNSDQLEELVLDSCISVRGQRYIAHGAAPLIALKIGCYRSTVHKMYKRLNVNVAPRYMSKHIKRINRDANIALLQYLVLGLSRMDGDGLVIEPGRAIHISRTVGCTYDMVLVMYKALGVRVVTDPGACQAVAP